MHGQTVASAGGSGLWPWQNTLWLMIIGVALVLALVWIVYRMNLRRAAERLRERLEERHSERERIARELHDTLLQGVHGLILRFQAVVFTIEPGSPTRISLEETLDRADQLLIEGRDRVRDLRTGAIDLSSLHDALRQLGTELERHGGTSFTMVVRGTPEPLRALVRDEIYQVGHEAIVNAFRHARARNVSVDIDYAPHKLTMTVSDDGWGIDQAYLTPLGRAEHWGLRGMHERAHRIGALLGIRSSSDAGSEILLSIKAQLAYCQRARRFWSWPRFSNTESKQRNEG